MKELKIVIAEDETLILMGLKSNLESLGHKVVGEASNGKELIDIVLERKPDLIIADINLPILGGLEALEIINQKMDVPSLIVSGYDDEELIQRATEIGVLGYLIKPIDESDLKAAIEIVISRFEDIKKLKEELDETKEALESRKIMERAKGIVMERLQLKEDEAMRFLQKKSRNSNKKLVEVANEIIEADKAFRLE
ncbi:ANTAR domain-containing response regulator [Petrotoga sp. 9PWA.NaAc.5.4]|uniref:ANTAR domain-containing response regulator n=1 Tax=Petrotoga sp. 9PWA.NaAc.5.4 TaxID=1434328 RepID=UPI000CB87D28|nr:response regulator [Petrotoga sp. 9PWA.NaAc.5.4]PNR92259.1 Fis family transcriptional regulator [Petrotoga sp. 9PWA.NaAc.5.4]